MPLDYGHEGKWYKEKCEKTKGLSYICKINEDDVIRDCPSGYENVKFGYDQVCLKLITSKRPWIEAEQERDITLVVLYSLTVIWNWLLR